MTRLKDLIGKRVKAIVGKFGRFERITGVVTNVDRNMIRIAQEDGKAVWIWKPCHRGERIEILGEP